MSESIRMTILLVLLSIILIILVLRLFIIKEGFENTTNLSKEFINEYTKFATFYNTFLTNWENAIITSIVSDKPQEPLESPTDVSSQQVQQSQPSRTEINTYITNLSSNLRQSLPKVTDVLPTQITSTDLPKIVNRLPKDTKPYINALNWMNQSLESSHANLNTALQGKTFETFENICQDFSKCLKDNKELAQQIAQLQEESNKADRVQLENDVLKVAKKFNNDTNLQTAQETNIDLIQKSQDIQDKAQSGDLYKQINIPGSKTSVGYTLPPGANALTDLQNTDPQKYDDYKRNYSHWFTIKQLIDQINSNL